MENWQQILVREMELRNLATTTKNAYLRDFKKFMDFHKGKLPIDLHLEDIKDFLHHFQNQLASGRNTKQSPSSINRVSSAIKFYYFRVHQRNYFGVITRVKMPKKAPLVLTQNEVKSLIESIHSVFYKAVIMTLYTTGMRQSELRNLKITDVDSSRKVIYIRNAKGAKDRQALLPLSLLSCLRTYWILFRKNNSKQSDYLFMPNKNCHDNSFNKPLSHTAVGYIIKKAGEVAGLKKKSILTA